MFRYLLVTLFILMMIPRISWAGDKETKEIKSLEKDKPDKESETATPLPDANKEKKVDKKIDTKAMKKLVTEAFKSLGKEPSLDTLIKAALKFAKAGMKNLEKLEIFSRRSAYLPRLKIIAENDIERDESLDRYQDEPDKWGADTDRDFGFLISAQWELGELIFNPDQVRVYNLIADTAKRREEIITWIVGLYFERRRLMIQAIIKPADDPMEMASAILRIHELGAQIDVLTGGRLMRDHGDRQ